MRESKNGFQDFINELVDNPIKFKEGRMGKTLFTESELKQLHQLTISQESSKPNVHRLSDQFQDTLIIGDIHGDIVSLEKITSVFLEEKVNSMIFLGDYVDRGADSLLVLCYLLSLNLKYPENVQLLRGNHEDQNLNRRYGFTQELTSHYPDKIKRNRIIDLLDEIFNYLSLCAVTPNRSICMHGGIPKGNPELNEINKIPKPHTAIAGLFKDQELEKYKSYMDGLLWNDPSEHITEEFATSPRGLGIFLFSEVAVTKFLEKNDLERCVRAHESSRGGFEKIFDGKILHIFSTQPYFNKIPDAYVIHEFKKNIIIRDLEFNEIKKIE